MLTVMGESVSFETGESRDGLSINKSPFVFLHTQVDDPPPITAHCSPLTVLYNLRLLPDGHISVVREVADEEDAEISEDEVQGAGVDEHKISEAQKSLMTGETRLDV
jgi:hypothetical protein